MATKRLFIIDVMAMAFRNFHAFGRNQLRNANGVPTSVVFGTINFILKLLREEKPDYFVLATDVGKETFRHKMYKEYKANRSEMPEELSAQLPYMYKLFDILGCVTLKDSGFEADDLIGTVVTQCKSDDLHCYIVSGDKDFMQLVDKNVSLYSPKKGGVIQVVNIDGVKEKFGCAPSQVIDILALMGDSSDNVPGVPGIGEKGACQLINNYGSLEGIYENLASITNKRQKKALEENRSLANLSKDLVTIKTDAPLPASLEDFALDFEKMVANPELLSFVNEMGFRRLADEISDLIRKANGGEKEDVSSVKGGRQPNDQSKEESKEPEDSVKKLVDRENIPYHLINSSSLLDGVLEKLDKSDYFCFDTETTGLDIINDKPIGISISFEREVAYYIPLVAKDLIDIDDKTIIEKLAPHFGDEKKTKVAHNLKFDLQMLENVGLHVTGPFADTMIMVHLLESNLRSFSLDACCLRYLNYAKIPTTDLIGKDKAKSMLDVDIKDLTIYACEDADYTLRLYLHLVELLEKDGLTKIFDEVEMPLIPILAKMEQEGVYLDTDVLSDLSDELDRLSKEHTGKIYKLAGEEFNINSPKQLQVILFEKLKIHEALGIKRIAKTKSGFSTNVSVLEQLSIHPLPRNILEYRTVSKLKNTYVDTLPQLVNVKTQRIHTNFHQTGTATGRLSSTGPNLQNIPIRSSLGRKIREAFCAPSDDLVIFSADYSQVELRILAHLAKDEGLIEAFRQKQDIHTLTAAKIFNVELTEVSSQQRAQAKAINFGIIYGMGPQRLAKETGVSMKEAKEFISKYFETYPRIKVYIDEAVEFAKEHEYTKTILGRRRPLPEINSSNRLTVVNAQNIAVNSPVQGSAADLIKLAMIKVQSSLLKGNYRTKMLLQVHDELVFESPVDELENAQQLVKASMEEAMDLDVPLLVDIGHGKSWLEAH